MDISKYDDIYILSADDEPIAGEVIMEGTGLEILKELVRTKEYVNEFCSIAYDSDISFEPIKGYNDVTEDVADDIEEFLEVIRPEFDFRIYSPHIMYRPAPQVMKIVVIPGLVAMSAYLALYRDQELKLIGLR